MAERRGHRVTAVGIGLLTVLGTAFLGACAALAVVGWTGDEGVANGHMEYLAGVIPFGLLAVGCLYWGLVWARRVGRGHTRHEGDYAQERLPAARGPAWLVVGPGVEAVRFIVGDEPVGYLAAGMMVTEVRRTGSRVLVMTPDGLSGWVDADRLEPAIQPTGDREGAMMGERRGRPVVAVLLAVVTLMLVGFAVAFASVTEVFISEGDIEPSSGRAQIAGVIAAACVVLVGGLVFAWLVATGRFLPRPAVLGAAEPPAPAPTPAVFVPCPGCGRTVNRDAGRCPYCQFAVEGGRDG